MKKTSKIIISIIIVIIIGFILYMVFMTDDKTIDNSKVDKKKKTQETNEVEGYEINVSKKELTINKGSKESFEITFTNPDESSIREYIKCEDQNDIVTVSYSPLNDSKITVEVEGLKEGTTEIDIYDYNYQDIKETVKVNVVNNEKSTQKDTNQKNTTPSSDNTSKSDGYEINVSKKELTIKKGAKESFEITFTNPDESSIREYINCEDQNDMVIVSYTPLNDSKITVEVEGLKKGTTEIEVCDYNYQNVKEIIKVNVTE